GSGNWSIILGAALSTGLHHLTAKATDVAGNTGAASAVFDLTILTGAAAPSGLKLDASTDSGTVGDNLTNFSSPKITGKANAGDTEQLFDGTTALSPTATVDGSGNWSITLGAALGDGVHSLTAKATDAAGNTSPASSPLSVTIDTTPPAPPANLALAPGGDVHTPTITGTAEANS